jgi:hypothetical protein
MSDDQKKTASGVVDPHKRDRQSRKPAPLPVRSTPDIFASSEATHLLEKAEDTALIDAIDDAPKTAPTAFSETPPATQILTMEEVQRPPHTNATQGEPHPQPSSTRPQGYHSDTPQASTTQLLDKPDLTGNTVFDSSDTTRALSGMFDEEEEKTAFFHTHDERAVPKPPPTDPGPDNLLVDPTPRRTLNEQSTSSAPLRTDRASQAPSPLPRRSNSRAKANVDSQDQVETPSMSASAHVQTPQNERKSVQNSKPRRRRSKSSKNEAAPPAEAINKGVFSEDASVIIDDVIGEVVKDSWKNVPSPDLTAGEPSDNQAQTKQLRTKTLWLRVGLGFLALIAAGFLLSSDQAPREADERKRSSTITTPLNEQVLTLGLQLPLSDSSRKLRPGTDVFVLGRRRVLLIINGTDQSELIHPDSLLRTLKSSAKLTGVREQLSAIENWPSEITVGLDRSTPISQVQRFCTVLRKFGVQRINLLTDSEAWGGVGELGMDVTSKIDTVPSIGALEMKVESALITLSLITPQSPSKVLESLDAFTPKLHKKLDEQIESFAFEHPRIVRAFISVSEGLRLSQIVELARPLLRDERMRRVTIVPYGSTPGQTE